jgi:hypothetical protein
VRCDAVDVEADPNLMVRKTMTMTSSLMLEQWKKVMTTMMDRI